MNLDRYLSGVMAGDADAFAAWMSEAEGPLRRSLAPLAAKVDAEAVLQEALLRVWQVAPRFTPDGRDNGLLRLAVRIARNLAISELRRTHGRAAEADEIERRLEQAAVGPATPSDPHLRRLIERCRQQLPDQPGRALTARLRAEGGVPDARLAEDLGMKKNTFLQNFGRARKLLKACLQSLGVDVEEELA